MIDIAWRAVLDSGANPPDPAGGVLFDLGPHLVDQALLLSECPRQFRPMSALSGKTRW